MGIAFHQQNTHSKLSNRKTLKLFIQKLFKQEKMNLEQLDYIFCTDEFLLQMNQQYLKHNYFTDIITFNLSENTNTIVGEVYISIDRVKENAIQFNTSYVQELHRVLFHGALHLCGYKDKSKKDQALMRQKENFYLHQY
ncbi:MAG TPA: rRNA maturation RNase YbeY, partial [Chitinophagaceae bacterium]|nr:rRNA maturation RNase YbeY [Chitinophagaceae bacterium]